MTDRLSKDKILQYKMAFDLFDRDATNTLAIKDLGILMRSLGQNPTEGELDQIIREHRRKRKGSKFSDEDSDLDVSKGKKESGLSFEQFLILMAEQAEYSHGEKEMIEMFKIFDLNADGFLSIPEIFRVLNGLGQKIQQTQVQDMVQQADLDGDKQINYEQFSRMMKRR